MVTILGRLNVRIITGIVEADVAPSSSVAGGSIQDSTILGRLDARIITGIVEADVAPLSSVAGGSIQDSTILGRLTARIIEEVPEAGSFAFREGAGKDCMILGRLNARIASILGGEASLITLTRLVARTIRIAVGMFSGLGFQSSTAGGTSFTTDEGLDGRATNSSLGSVHGINSTDFAVDIGETPRSSVAPLFPSDGFSAVEDTDPRGSDLSTSSSSAGGGGGGIASNVRQ